MQKAKGGDMVEQLSVFDIFKTQGQPTITYIEREQGKYEKELTDVLEIKGRLCLITGPSKTGKTTLYSKVLGQKNTLPIKISCDDKLSINEIWKKALEKVDFSRVRDAIVEDSSAIGAQGKISGKLGISWLAGIFGEVGTSIEKTKTASDVREMVLSSPSPDHLIPILKRLKYILVIEDFHYLQQRVQTSLFQQLKNFIDNEVSIIIVSTTHHAADLAFSNKDLMGRYLHLDISAWSIDDLKRIIGAGFGFLNITCSDGILSLVAEESVGLPIIVQSTCLRLCLNKDLKYRCDAQVFLSNDDAFTALHEVANLNYGTYNIVYDALITGPRKKARRYNTYEMLLAAFSTDPLAFSLSYSDIIERVSSLFPGNIPPVASIISTLNALKKFQQRLGIEILEWVNNHKKLYVVEPTFLFYIRWRIRRVRQPTLFEVFQEMMKELNEKLKAIIKTE
jgi:hypothetical protein